MWEEVLDAKIKDALSVVRLGGSLELGNFLGTDLVKGRGPTRCVFGPEGLNFFFFCTAEQGRSVKTFASLRDDVHGFIGACRKALDAGRDLYGVVMEYEPKRKARKAVSHGFPPNPLSKGEAEQRGSI